MTDTKPRLIRLQPLAAAIETRLNATFTMPPAPAATLSAAQLLEQAIEFQPAAILTSQGTQARADFINALPDSVKVISTISVGTDHIDLGAAKARGIIVTNTPDVLTDCNADLAMMLILGAARRATEHTAIMRNGWGKMLGMTELLGTRVSGKTIGIAGMGRIGRALAQRARGFGMTVLYHNRRRLDADLEAGATYFDTLDAMLPHCDILSLHMPASAESDSIINARTLSLLPRGAIFVNAARGNLVDEAALFDALESGQLFAAGLDVYRNEPNPDPRFFSLPNIFATPHVGSATNETRTDMANLAIDNALAVCTGKPAITPVSA